MGSQLLCEVSELNVLVLERAIIEHWSHDEVQNGERKPNVLKRYIETCFWTGDDPDRMHPTFQLSGVKNPYAEEGHYE